MGRGQFGQDLRLVLCKRLRERLEARLKVLVLRLLGQRLRPVESEIEVAAAIIELADFAGGRAVMFEDLGVGLIQRFREYFRAFCS